MNGSKIAGGYFPKLAMAMMQTEFDTDESIQQNVGPWKIILYASW